MPTFTAEEIRAARSAMRGKDITADPWSTADALESMVETMLGIVDKSPLEAVLLGALYAGISLGLEIASQRNRETIQ